MVIIIAVLLGCCCVAASGGGYWWWTQQSSGDTPGGGSEEPTAAPQGETAGDPADTVEAFYLALDSGDIDGIKATFVDSAAKDITPDWFEGITEVDYEVTANQVDGKRASVTVREETGLAGSGESVVFNLVLTDGSWRISGWDIGDVGALEGGSSGAGSGPSGSGASALGPETASEAVGEMLMALKNGNTAGAKAKATKRFAQDDPGFFSDTAGAFVDFDVVDVFQDAAVYVVVVNEDWISGPEETSYVVVEEDGKILVDSVLWMGE